jgi:hypothetical protein
MFGIIAWRAFQVHQDDWWTIKTEFPWCDVPNRVNCRLHAKVAHPSVA